jgi:hypothetical protein
MQNIQFKRNKILTGFLQYYHLSDWTVSVSFVRKTDHLVFEFVKKAKKEESDRSVLQTISRRLAQKKPVNWNELLLSADLRCTASFSEVKDTDNFVYAPLDVSLLVLVDPSTPLGTSLPPLELWKGEKVAIPDEVFQFPYVAFFLQTKNNRRLY